MNKPDNILKIEEPEIPRSIFSTTNGIDINLRPSPEIRCLNENSSLNFNEVNKIEEIFSENKYPTILL